MTLSQLILHYLTERSSAYVDIIMMEAFRVYCSCCGFATFEYARKNCRSVAYANAADKENTLFSNRLVNTSRYEDGIYTLARFNFFNGKKCRLQVILGENKNDFEPFYEMGCTEFPSIGLIVKENTSELLDKLGSQHFALINGDVVNRLKYFCKFMDIQMEVFR